MRATLPVSLLAALALAVPATVSAGTPGSADVAALQVGLVGLGRMGGNMRQRLRNAGDEVVGYDRNPEVRDADSLEAKWPAPVPPAWTQPNSPSGRSASKTGCAVATSSASPPAMRA